MKTKKAAAAPTRKVRKEHPGSDGPRRYTLRTTHYEISEACGEAYYDEPTPLPAAYGIRTHEPRRLKEAHMSATGEGGIRTPGTLYPKGRGLAGPLANRAQPARPELTFIPQVKPPRKENPFKKRSATGQAERLKVSLPQEFVEWAERQGFAPAAAARFVLAWFCERESVDRSGKVQYTCGNRTWPTNAPRTKKM